MIDYVYGLVSRRNAARFKHHHQQEEPIRDESGLKNRAGQLTSLPVDSEGGRPLPQTDELKTEGQPRVGDELTADYANNVALEPTIWDIKAIFGEFFGSG